MGLTIAKRDAIKEVDISRRVHHKSAKDALEKEYKWRERALDPTPTPALYGGGTYKHANKLQDPAEMAKQMRDYKKQYERGLPVALSATTRNELWKKAKRLKDQFVVGMLSKDELHPVQHKEIIKNGQLTTAVVADYNKMQETKAVERNSAWFKRNDKLLKQYKQVMRHLDPDNPKAVDIEKFRPATKGKS